jgi:hypothetical protein
LRAFCTTVWTCNATYPFPPKTTTRNDCLPRSNVTFQPLDKQGREKPPLIL